MNYPLDENLFYSAPTQQLDDNMDAEEDATYEEPAAEELLPPPDFKPFFTLIENPQTGEHHHPTVHYIFSDDDTEVLTSAALEALERGDDASQAKSRSDEAQERCVIVDMAADGKSVISASSMSPDWQALKYSVMQAPSWGDDSDVKEKGLMLKIAGRTSKAASLSKEKRQRQDHADSIDDLVKEFGNRLGGLDEVLGRTRDEADDQDTTT